MKVLLTGVSSGIGLATAEKLAAQGHQVVGTSRSPVSSKAFQWVEMDLSDPASVDKGFASSLNLLGEVEVLINNAGVGELGAVEDTPLEDSRKLFEVNYFASVQLIKKVLPQMRERKSGAILNLGSIVHDLQFPFKAQYCASKSALTSFSLALRYEVQPYGIRVHVFEPGWVRSSFHVRLNQVVREGSPYLERMKPFLDFTRDRNPKIPDGKDAAEIIVSVLNDPQAPVRVAVGRESKKFRIVRRFLSNQMLDRLLIWKLSKKGKLPS